MYNMNTKMPVLGNSVLVPITITGSSVASQYNLPDKQNFFSNKIIMAVAFWSESLIPVDPNGATLASQAAIEATFLNLSVVSAAETFKVQNYPCAILAPELIGNESWQYFGPGFGTWAWTSSYIKIADTTKYSVNEVLLMQVWYATKQELMSLMG